MLIVWGRWSGVSFCIRRCKCVCVLVLYKCAEETETIGAAVGVNISKFKTGK